MEDLPPVPCTPYSCASGDSHRAPDPALGHAARVGLEERQLQADGTGRAKARGRNQAEDSRIRGRGPEQVGVGEMRKPVLGRLFPALLPWGHFVHCGSRRELLDIMCIAYFIVSWRPEAGPYRLLAISIRIALQAPGSPASSEALSVLFYFLN